MSPIKKSFFFYFKISQAFIQNTREQKWNKVARDLLPSSAEGASMFKIPDLAQNPFSEIPEEDLTLPFFESTGMSNRTELRGKVGFHAGKQISMRPGGFHSTKLGNQLIFWIKIFMYAEYKNFPEILEKIPKNIRENPLFLKIFAQRASVSDSTHSTYIRKTKNLLTFAQKEGLTTVIEDDVFKFLGSKNLSYILKLFLLDKARTKGIAKTYIAGFKTALNYTLKLFLYNFTLSGDEFKTYHSAIGRIYGRKTKPTRAIPPKIFRYFLQFLRSTDQHSFKIFYLLFILGTRAGEAINIRKSDVRRFQSFDSQGYKIFITRPKTQKATADEGRTITFRRMKQVSDTDPVNLIRYFLTLGGSSKFLFPFRGTNRGRRLQKLWKWFKVIKNKFQKWLLRNFNIDFSTNEWRIHSLRTTLIGFMRLCKIPMQMIRQHVGHCYDSEVTEKIYFYNCILTEGFDQEFEANFDKLLKFSNITSSCPQQNYSSKQRKQPKKLDFSKLSSLDSNLSTSEDELAFPKSPPSRRTRSKRQANKIRKRLIQPKKVKLQIQSPKHHNRSITLSSPEFFPKFSPLKLTNFQ